MLLGEKGIFSGLVADVRSTFDSIGERVREMSFCLDLLGGDSSSSS